MCGAGTLMLPLSSHPRLAGSPRLDGSFGRAVRFGTFFVATTKLTTPRSRTRLPGNSGGGVWTATRGNYRDEAAVRNGFIANRVTMLQMAAI